MPEVGNKSAGAPAFLWFLFISAGLELLVFRRKVLELLFDFLQQFKPRCHPGNDGLNPARYSPHFVYLLRF
jgi:hypothetical protein